MKAIITRTKIYPAPGRNVRFAWKWLYDIEGLGVELRGFDRLDSARAAAKRNGATEVIESWREGACI